MSSKPTVISLFAGGGGSSLGYRAAGFQELLAVDFNKIAARHFKINLPNVPVLEKDIRIISTDEIKEYLNGTLLDVLDSSPPCQGFSISGKRVVIDPRNWLFNDVIRIAMEVKPKILLIENVPGMICGAMKKVFDVLIGRLQQQLPEYSIVVKLLNAANYGVAQSRLRLIIIAVRDDVIIQWPDKQVMITPGKALLNVTTITPTKMPSKYNYEILKRTKPGHNASEYVKSKSYFNNIKLSPHRPSPTLLVGTLERSVVWHWDNRPLAMEEVRELSGFPEDYQIENYKAGCIVYGNAVLPPFMQAIATSMRETLSKGRS